MLLDAHCHIQFPTYDSDRDAVIARAKKTQVTMVAVGTQGETSRMGIACAEANPELVWATVGFHPNHLSDAWHHDTKEQVGAKPEAFDEKIFLELAGHPRVVAIGECGLDYYRLIPDHKEIEKDRQRKVFLAHIRIAEKTKKALMIHCRPSSVKTSEGKALSTDDAYEDLLREFSMLNFQFPKIVHFYVGSISVTRKLIDAGFYFTFGGVITFSRDYDEVIRMIPNERILTETDAPYVAPEPYRGKRNEPVYITETAKRLAEIKGISYHEISRQTTANAAEVFKISL